MKQAWTLVTLALASRRFFHQLKNSSQNPKVKNPPEGKTMITQS